MAAAALNGDGDGDNDSDSDIGRERDWDSDSDDNAGGGSGSGGGGGSQRARPMVEVSPPVDLETLLSMPLYQPSHTSDTLTTTTSSNTDSSVTTLELSPDGLLAALRLLLPFSQRDDLVDVVPERIKTAVDDAHIAGSEHYTSLHPFIFTLSPTHLHLHRMANSSLTSLVPPSLPSPQRSRTPRTPLPCASPSPACGSCWSHPSCPPCRATCGSRTRRRSAPLALSPLSLPCPPPPAPSSSPTSYAASADTGQQRTNHPQPPHPQPHPQL